MEAIIDVSFAKKMSVFFAAATLAIAICWGSESL
jgi:hypothetical protein